jgi:hypothetical protein
MSATRAFTKANHSGAEKQPAGKRVQGEFISALDVSCWDGAPIFEGCGVA